MKRGIQSQNKHFINVSVESACPLDWLSQYYKEFKGKLIEIDDTLLSFIISHSDECQVERVDDSFRIVKARWNPGKTAEGVAFPSTYIRVEIFGKYNKGDGLNRNFITEIDAEDIPDFGFKADPKDSQIVFLKANIQRESSDEKV